MQSLGLRVFYDQDHYAHLWGKSRTEYEKIYGPDSAFVVPMISKHYGEREWTQWEFETAKREARKRKNDFILPIRIDESRQFGLTDDHNYLGADNFTPEEIAQALKTKLHAEYKQKTKTASTHSRGVAVLTLDAREALGLIVAGPIPVTVRHLKGFFPKVDWPKHIRRLKQLNLITDDGLVVASKRVSASFADELSELESRWVGRLEELQQHIDCALYLSILYINQGKLDDAVVLAADAALASESDHWLPLCTAILEAVNREGRLVRRLQPETRLEFFRAFGHCLSASRQFNDARAQFEKLKKSAARQKDMRSVGLALLNIGTNYHKQGDDESAIHFYERTREHARKHALPMLASHAIGNLGQIEIQVDPESGIELIRESIRLKRKCNDQVGIAASTQVLAQAFAELGDFDSAMQCYEEAEALARDLGLIYLQTLLLNNKGNTLFAEGKRSQAHVAFKKARKLAEAEGFDELRIRATEGVSRVHYSLGKLQEAVCCMEEVLELAKESGLLEFELTAYHGLWAAKTRLRKPEDASKHFNSLTRLARKTEAVHWLIRALVDVSRPLQHGDFTRSDPRELRKVITREARRGDKAATASLWFKLAEICMPDAVPDAVSGLKKCLGCCEGDDSLVGLQLDAREFLFTLYWDYAHQCDNALEELDAITGVAKRYRNLEKELAAIDQKGACLQDLDRCDEAMHLHKRVAARSQKRKLIPLSINSLHNLAECHRRLGNSEEALRVFDVAREVAADAGDKASCIEIDHGRALAYEDAKEFDTALNLFKLCRDRSHSMEWWSEYVRACEAIANLSWTRGRRKTALKQYEKALSECDSLDVTEAKPRIAYNLSRLVHLLGDVRKARRILAKHIDLVDDPLLLPDFHSTLAELCEQAGRIDEAREHWQIAVESAENVGDEEEISYCRSNYAEFERKHDNPKKSIQELDEMLKGRLSAEDRGIALRQLFKALLQRNSEDRAQEVFRVAQDHLQDHELTEQLIDLYMTAFDHNWVGNRDSRFSALQVYVAAFCAAAADPECEEHLSKIASHAMIKLTQDESAPSLPQLKWLASRLELWLAEQFASADTVAMLMHPLRYAERLIPFNKDPVRFLEEHELIMAQFDDS